jgi:hypothetical protein
VTIKPAVIRQLVPLRIERDAMRDLLIDGDAERRRLARNERAALTAAFCAFGDNDYGSLE